MFNRQFSLLVMATLLLSPDLVHANQIDGDTHLSVGNIQIHTTNNGTTIQTPQIQVNTPKPTENRTLLSRARRRSRTTAIRRNRTSAPAILNKRVSADGQSTVTTTTSTSTSTTAPIRSTNTSTSTIEHTTTTAPIRRSTIRSSTMRNSSNGSQSEQHQSMQCNGEGSSVSQSTSTVNGRTVSSEVRCP
jgi:hypothetical protein